MLRHLLRRLFGGLRSRLWMDPPSPEDFARWRALVGQWANERRSEIVYSTWTGERE